MRKQVLVFGLGGGLLVAALKFAEYRWLVVAHAFEIYAALVAALFAALGLWLGRRWTRPGRTPSTAARPAQPALPSSAPAEAPSGSQADAVPALDRQADDTMPAGGDAFARDEAALAASALTPRELEILQRIAEGLSTREIAALLFVSENTVKTHVARVLDKLGARRRTQAVQRARALRLIP